MLSPTPAPDYIVLDVETRGCARPEELQRELYARWRPDPRWKPETIGERFVTAWEKHQQRAALLDSADVVVVALASPRSVDVLHALGPQPTQHRDGYTVTGYGDTLRMLSALRSALDMIVTPETLLAGHNIRDFDLPRLRLCYLRTGLRMPACLASDVQPVADSMHAFCRRFSVSREPMVSLADACAALGLPTHKDLVSGEQVGELIERGEVDLLTRYAAADVIVERELFLRLHNVSSNLS